jgi:hypothetical protein
MKAVVDTLQVNTVTVMQEIELDLRCYDEAGEEQEAVRIHDEMIRPLLEANTIRGAFVVLRGLADASYKVAADRSTTEADASPKHARQKP